MNIPRTAVGGNWPVMVTPMNADRSIDWDSYERLTEWYIAAGVSGLFAVCQSSEMYFLSDEERIELTSRLVKRVDGQLPVIATGTFSYDIEQQTVMIRKMHDAGADVVVCLTNYLARETASEENWQRNCMHLLEKTGNIPLGLYECPVPYKRLLSPATTQVVAETDRFYWYKETSEDAATVIDKSRVSRGTNLNIYNAHTRSLLTTLRAGTAGFCGIASNFYPALFSWMCKNHSLHIELADGLSEFLGDVQATVDHKYPFSAKHYLHRLGVIASPVSRTGEVLLTTREMEALDILREKADTWTARLGI